MNFKRKVMKQSEEGGGLLVYFPVYDPYPKLCRKEGKTKSKPMKKVLGKNVA